MVAACATAPAPPPLVEPQGDARYLIDPRTGFDKPADPNFDLAWRYYLSGNDAEAQKRIAMMPGYAPASLLAAAIDIRAGRLDEASAIIAKLPSWSASNVYAAEIALARNDLPTAYRLYQQVANPPEIVATRLADVRKRLFDQLVAGDSIAS